MNNGSNSARLSQRSNLSTPNRLNKLDRDSNNKIIPQLGNQNILSKLGSMNKYDKLIILKLKEILIRKMKNAVAKIKEYGNKNKLNKYNRIKCLSFMIERNKQIILKSSWRNLLKRELYNNLKYVQNLKIVQIKRNQIKLGLLILNKTFKTNLKNKFQLIHKQNRNKIKYSIALQNLNSLIQSKCLKIKRHCYSKIIKLNNFKWKCIKSSLKLIKNIINFKLHNYFTKISTFNEKRTTHSPINTPRKSEIKKKISDSRIIKKQQYQITVESQKPDSLLKTMQIQMNQQIKQVYQLQIKYDKELLRNKSLVAISNQNKNRTNYFELLVNIYEFIRQNKDQDSFQRSILEQKYVIQQLKQNHNEILQNNLNLKREIKLLQNLICGSEQKVLKKQIKSKQLQLLQLQNEKIKTIIQNYVERNYLLDLNHIRNLHSSLLQKLP